MTESGRKSQRCDQERPQFDAGAVSCQQLGRQQLRSTLDNKFGVQDVSESKLAVCKGTDQQLPIGNQNLTCHEQGACPWNSKHGKSVLGKNKRRAKTSSSDASYLISCFIISAGESSGGVYNTTASSTSHGCSEQRTITLRIPNFPNRVGPWKKKKEVKTNKLNLVPSYPGMGILKGFFRMDKIRSSWWNINTLSEPCQTCSFLRSIRLSGIEDNKIGAFWWMVSKPWELPNQNRVDVLSVFIIVIVSFNALSFQLDDCIMQPTWGKWSSLLDLESQRKLSNHL